MSTEILSARHHEKSPVLFGVRVDNFSIIEIFDEICGIVENSRKTIFAYANIHTLNLSYSLPWFRTFLNRADNVFCDGYGVMLGARLTGQKLEHRYTPPDWLGKLCEMSSQQGFTLYLIGSRPGVASKAADLLVKQNPGCRIVGTHDGYFDKYPGSEENEAVLADINRLKPNILIVGFGMPLQEKWIEDNFDQLEVNVFLPVGAAFDYISGEVKRAPRWMTDHGLEWLGRLVIEPRRLWRRYIIGIPLFFWRVFKQRAGILKLPEKNVLEK